MIKKNLRLTVVIALLFCCCGILTGYQLTVTVTVCNPYMEYTPNDTDTGDYHCENGTCGPDAEHDGNADGYQNPGCTSFSVTTEVPEGVSPEQAAAIIADLVNPDSPDKDTVDDANKMGDELDDAKDVSKKTSALDQLKAELEDKITQATKEALGAENNQNSTELGDPVQPSSGQFVTESSDISYSFINSLIDLKRGYQSYPLYHKSMGNWWFSYDTRIILGIKYNAVGIANQALIEYNEAKAIYDTELAHYTEIMSELNALILNEQGKPKGKLELWKESLEKTLVSLDNVYQTAGYPEVRTRIEQDRAGILNVLNNYLIPFIGRVQAAKTALLASNTKLQQLKVIMDNFFDIAKQMAKEAKVTLAHESRNEFVYASNDSSFLLGTGNRSLTLVDENGDTHLYTINAEPFYESPTTYPDGSINYYPAGAACTPERVNDDLLYIELDGSYTITKKNKTQYSYSFFGQLEKITDTNGNEIKFVYDTNHKLVKITDAFDRSTNIDYSGSKIIKITDPKNRTVGYAYDSEGRLASVTDPQGDSVLYEYNANFISAIVKPDESRRIYNYTQLGDKYVIDLVTDEEGYSSKFIYYPEQNYTEYVNESGISEKHYYNDKNLETKVVYSDGSFIEMQYDEKNNVTSRIDELGKTTLFAYDAARNLIQATDANGYSERWTYNQWNKVSQYTDKLGNVTTYQYDPKGNLTSVTFPDYSTMSYGYNEKGQLVSETDQLGNASQLSYNSVGYIESVTDREGNTTRQATDTIGIDHGCQGLRNVIRIQYGQQACPAYRCTR
jgi:YD repeat-containing protein